MLDNSIKQKLQVALDEAKVGLSRKKEEYTEKHIILNSVLDLYEGKVGNSFSQEDLKILIQEGKDRYEKRIPPGYKDKDKESQQVNKDRYGDTAAYGDLIIWKQLLEKSKNDLKPIIFVTNDVKEDWWRQESGKTLGPRIELLKEFEEKTGQKFYLYTRDNFLKKIKDYLGIDVKEETLEELKILDEKQPVNHYKGKANSFERVELSYIDHHLKTLKRERSNNVLQRLERSSALQQLEELAKKMDQDKEGKNDDDDLEPAL